MALPGIALADLHEEQKLAPTLNVTALAGHSSALSGDTAVVGAPGDTGDVLTCPILGGAAYVYTRSGSLWTKVATLCASDGQPGDEFGESVSISGGNIAVGAPGRSSGVGAVYVYTGGGASWTENASILSATLNSNAHLGQSVSIQGFRVAAGAPNATINGKGNVGIVAVFDSNDSGATWLRQTFRPNGGQGRTGSLFGTSVAVAGSTVLAGAPGYHTGNKPNSGSVFIFVNNGGTWTQQANVRPSNTAGLFSGTSVALFQNTAAFGAPGATSGKGAAYVYQRTGTAWAQVDSVTAGAAGDHFGTSVSIQGSPFTALAVGAPDANSGAGRAYEFGSSGAGYSLLNELIATDNAAGDAFGTSTGLDAGRIIVGAPDALGTTGAAYIFRFQSASVTAITGFSVDPSLTNVPYDVTVTVTDGSGNADTPTGSVDIDDGHGGACTATLAASGDADGHAVGTCSITSTFFGTVTISASYGGDVDFSGSIDTTQHDVTGNHLVFNPIVDVVQGTQVNGVVVEVRDGADQLITGDNTTNVSLSVDDTCGNTDPIATLQVVGGVATFTDVGPKMYTVTSGHDLNMNATSDDGTSPAAGGFDVTANTDILFADGFEDCRL